MISTPRELAERYGIDWTTVAIAAQTMGEKEYFRAYIKNDGITRILCAGPNGKGAMTASDVFAHVYKEPLEKKRARK